MAFFSRQQKKTQIEQELDPSNFTSMHTAIGFSVMGLVGALMFSVVVENSDDRLASVFPDDDQNFGIDRTVVGSITKSDSKKGKVRRYTVRQSILQKNSDVPCIISADGTQRGNC